MKWIQLMIWAFAGSGLAAFSLAMQQWTVNKIHPDHVKTSKRLVIGGAILRWLLFSFLIFLAFQNSLAAMLSFSITFITTRMILLFSLSPVKTKIGETN